MFIGTHCIFNLEWKETVFKYNYFSGGRGIAAGGGGCLGGLAMPGQTKRDEINLLEARIPG